MAIYVYGGSVEVADDAPVPDLVDCPSGPTSYGTEDQIACDRLFDRTFEKTQLLDYDKPKPSTEDEGEADPLWSLGTWHLTSGLDSYEGGQISAQDSSSWLEYHSELDRYPPFLPILEEPSIEFCKHPEIVRKTRNKQYTGWVCDIIPCPGKESGGSRPIFTTLRDRMRHYNEVHGCDASGNPIIVFMCHHSGCDRSVQGFTRAANYRRHLLMKHKDNFPDPGAERAGGVRSENKAAVENYRQDEDSTPKAREHTDTDQLRGDVRQCGRNVSIPKRSSGKSPELPGPHEDNSSIFEQRNSKPIDTDLCPPSGSGMHVKDAAFVRHGRETPYSNIAELAVESSRDPPSTSSSAGRDSTLECSSDNTSITSSPTSDNSDLTTILELNVHARSFVEDLAQKIVRCCLSTDRGKLKTCPESDRGGEGGSIAEHHTGSAPENSQPNLRKRGRSNDGDKGDQKDDDDNDANNVNDPAKKQCLSKRFWACPYTKFDPLRYSEHNQIEKSYRKCPSAMLLNITQLKQHLRRNHLEPKYFCGKCYTSFATKRELLHHNREVCTADSPRFQEMMNEDQYLLIPKYLPNDCTSWNRIFRIIFNDTAIPASPYVTISDASKLQHFIELFRLFGPQECLGLLWSRLNQDPQSIQFNAPLRVLIEETIEIAFPDYYDMLQIMIADPSSQGSAVTESQSMMAQPRNGSQTPLYAPQNPNTSHSIDHNCYVEAASWMSAPGLITDAFDSVASERSRQLDLVNEVEGPIEGSEEPRTRTHAG